MGTGLDVLAERLQAEYGLRVTFETSRFEFARLIAKCPAERDRFIHAHPASVARDLDGAAVFLAASAFDLKYEQDKWPDQALAGEMRAYAENKYNPEAMVAGHLALYRDLLAGGAFPAKRPAPWMDFAVRAAVNIYWGGSRAAS